MHYPRKDHLHCDQKGVLLVSQHPSCSALLQDVVASLAQKQHDKAGSEVASLQDLTDLALAAMASQARDTALRCANV